MRVPPLKLPCGSTAIFDLSTECSHRCTRCNATVGSIGTPRDCKAAMDKYKTLQALGSNISWDYDTGEEIVTVEFGE